MNREIQEVCARPTLCELFALVMTLVLILMISCQPIARCKPASASLCSSIPIQSCELACAYSCRPLQATERLQAVTSERERLQQRNKLLELALANTRGSQAGRLPVHNAATRYLNLPLQRTPL